MRLRTVFLATIDYISKLYAYPDVEQGMESNANCGAFHILSKVMLNVSCTHLHINGQELFKTYRWKSFKKAFKNWTDFIQSIMAWFISAYFSSIVIETEISAELLKIIYRHRILHKIHTSFIFLDVSRMTYRCNQTNSKILTCVRFSKLEYTVWIFLNDIHHAFI